MAPASAEWFDEIELDPGSRWLRMGTRQLGARPWLVIDERREEELALKARLLAERHRDVFAVEPTAAGAAGAERAGAEVLALVGAECRSWGLEPEAGGGRLHPLDRAGRSVQEDLCLQRPDPSGWVLAAASLCFPSRWRLEDKLGRPLVAVHGPVEGYRSELAARVEMLFDRLVAGPPDRIVWRRNWFVHPDPALFQPDRPPGGDPIVGSDRCLDHLYLRSERQTLRPLPASGWVLFTIRTQQAPLGPFLDDPGRRARFVRWLGQAPPDQLAHRGVGPAQLAELVVALGPVVG